MVVVNDTNNPVRFRDQTGLTQGPINLESRSGALTGSASSLSGSSPSASPDFASPSCHVVWGFAVGPGYLMVPHVECSDTTRDERCQQACDIECYACWNDATRKGIPTPRDLYPEAKPGG